MWDSEFGLRICARVLVEVEWGIGRDVFADGPAYGVDGSEGGEGFG